MLLALYLNGCDRFRKVQHHNKVACQSQCMARSAVPRVRMNSRCQGHDARLLRSGSCRQTSGYETLVFILIFFSFFAWIFLHNSPAIPLVLITLGITLVFSFILHCISLLLTISLNKIVLIFFGYLTCIEKR